MHTSVKGSTSRARSTQQPRTFPHPAALHYHHRLTTTASPMAASMLHPAASRQRLATPASAPVMPWNWASRSFCCRFIAAQAYAMLCYARCALLLAAAAAPALAAQPPPPRGGGSDLQQASGQVGEEGRWPASAILRRAAGTSSWMLGAARPSRCHCSPGAADRRLLGLPACLLLLTATLMLCSP